MRRDLFVPTSTRYGRQNPISENALTERNSWRGQMCGTNPGKALTAQPQRNVEGGFSVADKSKVPCMTSNLYSSSCRATCIFDFFIVV